MPNLVLKTNITNISSSLDKVKKLRPVEFDWLINRDKHEYGLIAQEVEEVVPMLVSEHNALGDTKKFLKELDGTYKSVFVTSYENHNFVKMVGEATKPELYYLDLMYQHQPLE